MFFINSKPSQSGCAPKAVASRFLDTDITFTGAADAGATTGATAVVLAEVSAGDPAWYGGGVHAAGCNDAKLVVTEIIGDDCDDCTVDTLETRTYERVVPKGGYIEIPPGYWQKIEVTLLDDAGDPVDLPENATEKVYLKVEQPGHCSAKPVLAV